MVPASVGEVLPKVESIMCAPKILIGPLSTAIGLMPTEDEVICNSIFHQDSLKGCDMGKDCTYPCHLRFWQRLIL